MQRYTEALLAAARAALIQQHATAAMIKAVEKAIIAGEPVYTASVPHAQRLRFHHVLSVVADACYAAAEDLALAWPMRYGSEDVACMFLQYSDADARRRYLRSVDSDPADAWVDALLALAARSKAAEVIAEGLPNGFSLRELKAVVADAADAAGATIKGLAPQPIIQTRIAEASNRRAARAAAAARRAEHMADHERERRAVTRRLRRAVKRRFGLAAAGRLLLEVDNAIERRRMVKRALAAHAVKRSRVGVKRESSAPSYDLEAMAATVRRHSSSRMTVEEARAKGLINTSVGD